MRRAQVRFSPTMTRFYGFKPWEVWGGPAELYPFEVDEYHRQLVAYQQGMKKASRA